MSKNNIWYLPGPFHQYQEDIKALAKESGLVIVDANSTESRNGEAKNVPEITIRSELLLDQGSASAGGGRDEAYHAEINGIREDLKAVAAITESFAAMDLKRPAGDLGETACRLFQVLEAFNASISSLQRERDGEVEKVAGLEQERAVLLKQNAELLKQVEALKAANADPEIEALKAKLDAANVSYRSNASKESLEKAVSELPKA
ncbi:hypothetical protein [Pseudomonas piscis]|uniref:hypothetical protein n=1 Tax=Pseudomonas piscis TaxID=2614538 RepID=UPI0004CFD93B|nr:hypothetical protein [Pseudomonas piscis]